jgi:hypothetical protein
MFAGSSPCVTRKWSWVSSFGGDRSLAALPGPDGLDEVPELVEGKTTLAIVKGRVNPARFRRAILVSYNARCCFSGLAEPRLLVASHTVPWGMDTQNRLNPQNGPGLSAVHDKAFDLGLITVLPDFTIRVARRVKASSRDNFSKDAIASYDGRQIALPERFGPNPLFLPAHAKHFEFIEGSSTGWWTLIARSEDRLNCSKNSAEEVFRHIQFQTYWDELGAQTKALRYQRVVCVDIDFTKCPAPPSTWSPTCKSASACFSSPLLNRTTLLVWP